MLIEPLGRAAPALVRSGRLRAPRREVPEQRPGPAPPAACLLIAVQVLTGLEVPVHPPHHPIDQVTGPMTLRVDVGDRPPRPLRAQGQDRLQDHPRELLLGPLAQAAESLGEAPAIRRPIGRPDPAADLAELLAQMLGPVAD